MARRCEVGWTVMCALLALASGCSGSKVPGTDGRPGDTLEGGVAGHDGSVVDAARADGAAADVPALPGTPDAPVTADAPANDVPIPAGGVARTTPTNGSAVAITRDDKYAVAANRTAGRVTVFRLDLGGTTPATKLVDLDVGKAAEPWSLVIGNDDATAYVVLRHERQVVKINDLRGTPAVDAARAATGSEPTGIAISPTGETLYVANWAEGTVSVVSTATMSVMRTVDLNAALASSGLLGPAVAARPALAHPRSVVVTNNGDGNDNDEHVYVTEFFSQARADALPTDDSRFDLGRQGVVYTFDAAGATAALITIAPVADTGFPDSKGQTTGCFPNQLYASAIKNNFLYVTSVCESPRGPVGADAAFVAPGTLTSNFKTEVHAAVFVIDLTTGKEVPGLGLLLTREFDRLYTGLNRPNDASRRLPLIPSDIMFAAGSTIGYVSGYGSDAVFRIAYRADGSLETVGAAAQPFIDLKAMGGELPVGIASANTGVATLPFALAINENSRNLSVITFNGQLVVATVPSTDPPAAPEVSANRGKKFFVTGLGRWSLQGQAWNSCESCHPDGLTDNVTWFFARGPRQTISLDATYDPKNPAKRRLLNWSAIFDEVHDFENNTRGNSGGVGAIVHRNPAAISNADRIIFDGALPAAEQLPTPTLQTGLNGSTISLMPTNVMGVPPLSVLPDWNDIDDYFKHGIRSPRAPVGLALADVAIGKILFDANACAGCHGTSQWTVSSVFFTPGEENNKVDGLLRTTQYTRPAAFPEGLNPPTAGAAGGKAFLRLPAPAADDQISCALRDVGTYPIAGTVGVAPDGVSVKEVRQDMTVAAQGATGFNIPSLLALSTGAPYFHAGAARTLEEALGDTFDRHRRAMAENFRPDLTQIRQLTAYILSIDEETPPPTTPTLGFNPDLCSLTPAGVIR
jgi:YVTN family beta-propeller protein